MSSSDAAGSKTSNGASGKTVEGSNHAGDLPALDTLRKGIDKCDREIIRLLNERMKICQQIGQAKGRMLALEAKKEMIGEAADKKNGPKQVYRPAREKLVFDKVSRINGGLPGPLTDIAVKAIYREVMSCSINLQQPTTIGYLGPTASSSHTAAVSRFGASMGYKPIESTAEILEQIKKGELSYGVVPFGNSHAGMESNTLDELAGTAMKVYAEIEIPTKYLLLSMSKDLKEIKTVYGSQLLLKECRTWLQINLPQATHVTTHSTERAYTRAKEEGTATAAVGTQLAADICGLSVISEGIEDRVSTSRFFVISQVCEPPSGEDKTFVMFSLRDAQGALFRALKALKEEGVNLTNIESRPSGSKAWDYNFFVRMDGHEQDKNIRAALEHLKKVCSYVRVLGSYPANKHDSK
mmetsp:Transcript_25567/g.47671  ORF Transcript_25567/g.47671 Transcript_25567/m.47671 type:complete len:410 (-) Transcript_25567:190-1419(-)|eukprot:CAMPEP_0170190922 /NCGR_PEP_ID=MMETSP0040_2-20121228/50448_1 /TAXON_ID=641309 /ORGANISM="Lotharella oceanica, Strain CCMP622" /LENGTH=409 /DNA_ID=CAMNT_0010438889 /DNA_START=118 /DNA_END=1347 /DNA_ORIENTATION=+